MVNSCKVINSLGVCVCVCEGVLAIEIIVIIIITITRVSYDNIEREEVSELGQSIGLQSYSSVV